MSKYRRIGERLHLLRGASSQEAFAKLFGLRRPVYRRYETGEREPPTTLLVKLAKHGKTTVDWILTGKNGFRTPQPLPIVMKEPGATYGDQHDLTDCRAVPILRRRLAGSPSTPIVEGDIEAYMVLPTAVAREHQYVVRIDDHSMTPLLKRGDLVGIEELSGRVESQRGRIVAVWIDKLAGLIIRRFDVDSHYWILTPENRTHRSFVIPRGQQNVRFFLIVWWIHQEEELRQPD